MTLRRIALAAGTIAYAGLGAWIAWNIGTTHPSPDDELQAAYPYRDAAVAVTYVVFGAALARNVRRGSVAKTLLTPVRFVVAAVVVSLVVLAVYAGIEG